jgi:hypothetical protein
VHWLDGQQQSPPPQARDTVASLISPLKSNGRAMIMIAAHIIFNYIQNGTRFQTITVHREQGAKTAFRSVLLSTVYSC